MKSFKINTIMLLLLLTFVFSIGTIPVFAKSEWRAGYLNFVSPEGTKSEIDNAYNSGLNIVILQHPRGYLDGVRSGKIKDIYPASIEYAHIKGMKVVWLIDFKQIPVGEDVKLFLSNPVYEEELVSDISWILKNYNIDGLELEEPVIGGSGKAGRDYLNKLFTRLRVLIDAKTAGKPDFKYGFNSPGLADSSIADGGLDQIYISNNRLFDYVAPQISVTTLGEYQYVYEDWTKKFENLDKIHFVFIWWATLNKADACSWANGKNKPTTLYTVPACYNQALFEQVKWLNSNNLKFAIWPSFSMNVNDKRFPNDHTPGNNIGKKFQWILSNNNPLPQTPVPQTPLPQTPAPQKPVIKTQPSSRTVTTGQTVTFSITSAGQTPLTYQWLKNGVNIHGATGATYTPPLASSGDNGANFRVVVSNAAGSVTSNIATLAVTSPSTPTTSIDLINNPGFESGINSWQFYTEGIGTFDTVSRGYEGNNAARLAFSSAGANTQLYQDGITLEPNTRYRLSFSAKSNTGHDVRMNLMGVPYSDYGLSQIFDLGMNWQTFTTEFTTKGFTDTVSNGRIQFWIGPFAAAWDNYFIDDIRLEKTFLPIITTHPSDQTVSIGETSKFNIMATDTAQLTYQWQKNGVDIPGATGASYTNPSTILSDDGSTFSVKVINPSGSVTSKSAILTVTSKNIIINQGFESGTFPWFFYTTGTGTFTAESPGYEGKSATIALKKSGSNMQLYQEDITLESNTRYRLSFAAYSNGDDMSVRLFKHDSPYTDYGLTYTVDLNAGWQIFTTEFTSRGFTGTVTDGRLMFWFVPFAAGGEIYHIDNIRLEKIG